MKRWGYLLSGILIGVVVATAGSAAAAQVKSLIGQKVSAELTVVVNGKELPNKGAVINGTTNAPVRALVDAVGGNLALEGKVITITTTTPAESTGQETRVDIEKQFLLIDKETAEKQINDLEERRKLDTEKYNEAEEGMGKQVFKQAIDSYTQQIEDKTKQLEEINAKLVELEK